MKDYDEEQWIEHPIYTNYIISSEGRVYNYTTNKILNGTYQNKDVRYVLFLNGSRRNFSGLDLVIDTFYQNDNNEKIIIKNNGKFDDNSLNNLNLIDKNLFYQSLPNQSEEMIEIEIDNKKITVPIWKKIEDYPLYRISYQGEIFSCSSSLRQYKFVWEKLNLSCNGNGYKQAAFYKDKKERKIYVHKLVLETYVSKKPGNLECCHKDGNKLNNCVSNLRWGTPLSNTRDRYAHNTIPFGEKHPRRVLTEEKVLKIHDLKSKGLNSQQISELMNIKERTIATVIRGGNWKWLHPTLAKQFLENGGKYLNK